MIFKKTFSAHVLFKDFLVVCQDRTTSHEVIEDISLYLDKEEKIPKEDKRIHMIKKIFIDLQNQGMIQYLGHFFIIPAPEKGMTWDINTKCLS